VLSYHLFFQVKMMSYEKSAWFTKKKKKKKNYQKLKRISLKENEMNFQKLSKSEFTKLWVNKACWRSELRTRNDGIKLHLLHYWHRHFLAHTFQILLMDWIINVFDKYMLGTCHVARIVVLGPKYNKTKLWSLHFSKVIQVISIWAVKYHPSSISVSRYGKRQRCVHSSVPRWEWCAGSERQRYLHRVREGSMNFWLEIHWSRAASRVSVCGKSFGWKEQQMVWEQAYSSTFEEL
jgi:hypothetical protein